MVNGSQTLHSVCGVENPSPIGRVMVRIIQVHPPSPADFSNEATKRRDIIEKISIRSNLQNPIKKWNLISNDLYQHELARFFRKRKLYYERRDGEWASRRTELRSIGIRRGPHIKALTQLIASYYWDKKALGPVVAKGGRAGLFDQKPYAIIKNTRADVVYQLYLLGQRIERSVKELSQTRQDVEEVSTYVRLGLFALVVKALQAGGAKFGSSDMQKVVEQNAQLSREWLNVCRAGIDVIRAEYRKAAKTYRQRTGKQLTLANFSKAKEYLGPLLDGQVPPKLARFVALSLSRAVN